MSSIEPGNPTPRRRGLTAPLYCALLGGLLCLAAPISLSAQDEDALAEMAKKAQDPLADVKSLMTDNTIGFNGGRNETTTYGFQLQPVYSIDNDTGWNIITRGIVPIAGIEPGVVMPPIGPEPRPPVDSTWGLSDSFAQVFFSPKSDAAWKWGIGPQVSLKTSTSDRLAGPGWGGGLAGVVFGGVGNVAIGALLMYHWGEDNYEVGTFQSIGAVQLPQHARRLPRLQQLLEL